MSFELEICCYNFTSCLIAEQAGGTRIELCADPGSGGITPGYGTIRMVKEKTRIPVYPIIRPRGGDFLYSDDEYVIMRKDIIMCKELGCEGIVIGLLHVDGSVDKRRTAMLVELAYPMGVTFHRAFDRAANAFEALTAIVETGCERILTSGQRPHAADAMPLLGDLVRSAGEDIIIMPGSGVRAANITVLAEKTGAREFHSSAGINLASKMAFKPLQMEEELTNLLTDKEEIKAMAEELAAYFAEAM
jgi:copper homeostasis protein